MDSLMVSHLVGHLVVQWVPPLVEKMEMQEADNLVDSSVVLREYCSEQSKVAPSEIQMVDYWDYIRAASKVY